MGSKLHAFVFALLRWILLVLLAVAPTAVFVVAYRKLRGRPLWSLADIPVAAEVTLCVAWLSLLVSLHDMFLQRLLMLESASQTAALAAGMVAAVPVALAYRRIDELRRILGVGRAGQSVHDPACAGA